MEDAGLEKPAADNSESYFRAERNGGILRLEPQVFRWGLALLISDITAFIRAVPRFLPRHALRTATRSIFCNAGLVDAPASRGDRDATINTQDMAANVLMLIDFEMDIGLLLDFKHQRTNDDAAAVVLPACGYSETNHGYWYVARGSGATKSTDTG